MSELKEALENASVTQEERILRIVYINLPRIESQSIVKIYYCSVLGNRDPEILTVLQTGIKSQTSDLPWYLDCILLPPEGPALAVT